MADTRDTADRRPSGTRDVLVAGLAALLVLGLAGVGADRSHRLTAARADAADEAVAATLAVGVGTDLERGLRGVAAAAAAFPSLGLRAVSGPNAAASVPGSIALGFVPLTGSLPEEAGPPVLPSTARADPRVAAVLDRARGTGEPQLGPVVELADGLRAVLAAPVYGAGPADAPPQTAAERRSRLAGWVIATVDLASIAADHAPVGGVVVIEDAGTRVQLGDPTGVSDAERTLLIAGRSLVLAASAPGGEEVSATTWGLAAAGLLLGPLAAAVVLATRRRLREQHAVVERRGSQVRMIGEVAPLVQQSLDLSEVLPAVAVQLSDHFGLAGVSLSTGTARAGQTVLFSVGVSAPPSSPRLRPPSELASGETLTLALQRGGRSVALLQVVAGRPLDALELDSLRALTELVTAAMVNASLYASQQEALQRLRDLDGLKTVFLGTASHELRTPATAIAGFASLLFESWDRFSDEQRRDFTGRIAANARSLSAVVQDLLDVSLLDRGDLPLELEPLDVGALVESVVDRLGPAFTEHVVACTTRPVPPVAGDRNGLERVATNLLTNAAKFSPAGSTISVDVGPDPEGVAIVVSDQGPGVPPEERTEVFTRFYRGTGEAVTQARGIGIGLSVVAEFVTRMRGAVTVDDAPGGGARFTVRLPAVAETVQEAADAPTA